MSSDDAPLPGEETVDGEGFRRKVRGYDPELVDARLEDLSLEIQIASSRADIVELSLAEITAELELHQQAPPVTADPGRARALAYADLAKEMGRLHERNATEGERLVERTENLAQEMVQLAEQRADRMLRAARAKAERVERRERDVRAQIDLDRRYMHDDARERAQKVLTDAVAESDVLVEEAQEMSLFALEELERRRYELQREIAVMKRLRKEIAATNRRFQVRVDRMTQQVQAASANGIPAVVETAEPFAQQEPATSS